MYWRRNVQFQCVFPLFIIVSCNKVWQNENEDVHPCNSGFYCDYIIFCVSLAVCLKYISFSFLGRLSRDTHSFTGDAISQTTSHILIRQVND